MAVAYANWIGSSDSMIISTFMGRRSKLMLGIALWQINDYDHQRTDYLMS